MDPQYEHSRWTICNYFATPAKNDPWVPPGVVLPSDRTGHHLPEPSPFVPPQAFLDYRSTGSPSDCATLPGDSGYGSSHPTYSIASASVHGGDDAGLGHVLSECRINREAVPLETPTPPTANSHHCDDCSTWFKSQGELKKHRQRHLKSHKCPYDSCSKGQRGFSTSNDLVRHKRSVHGEHNLPGRSFVCSHCNHGSRGPKVWPRADNFRSHLLRTHHMKLSSEDDHTPYLYQPPAKRNDLEGVGSSVDFVDSHTRPMCLNESPVLSGPSSAMDLQFRDSQFAQSQEPPLTGQGGIDPAVFQRPPAPVAQPRSAVTVTSAAGEEAGYIYPLVLSGPLPDPVGDAAEIYTMPHRPDFAVDAPGYSQEQLPDDGGDGAKGCCLSALRPRDIKPAGQSISKSWKPDESGRSESTQPGLDDVNADMASSQQCGRVLDDGRAILDLMMAAPSGTAPSNSEILRCLRRLPREILQTALRGDGQDTEADGHSEDESSSRAQVECPDPDCGKSFSRQCELKKHMKRHGKPYGCTFRSCSKRFGSKNDWKRHESSQHYLLETWACNEPGCNKSCQRRESFKNHLQKDHDMTDAERIDAKLEACLLGRHCDPRFWCGFCVRVIHLDINEKGGNSWTKRCDHIDNHLFGKEGLEKKPIREWKHQEDQQGPSAAGVGTCRRLPVAEVAPGEVEGNERKRRSSAEDANVRPRKKANKTQTYMWTCCMCSTMMNLKTSSCCFECHHPRCSRSCTVEYVFAPESDEDWDADMGPSPPSEGGAGEVRDDEAHDGR